MKRILINATHNEEIRVALCKGNHLYDFDLENRTREQKKSNIYKGHVTRVEPSLEAVFVEYGSQRQGFLPIREIANEYLKGNARDENIRKLIKEGDELIVQVEKEERGNKGAALSTYVSLAGRYLVLMPNNPRGGGISRQISGKLREDMKRMLSNLDLPKGMSVIIRTAGIGKTQEDLQHDLNHLLNIWEAIQEQNKKYPSPRLVHQEAGVVTRAVRDYLRDDIAEIWIDNENAYIEAAGFIEAVMPTQADKLRKYTDFEPMFARFGIEKQIETAYQREVRLPSGGSIVIDQTEALVSIDINSAKSTKGSDVAETAYHTNLEAADEIARQLRLRDMGGLIVIDFIDMNDSKHQKEVEKRLVDATKYDRARVQFGDISRFGLMEMSRQRLRPSLEESTGYICPRCHGNGMIRDLRSLSLSIMRQIEQIALKERQGEVQAEVPTDIAAFLLNEKRDSLVYLEQDSGTRITILPHAHLDSPNFKLHFNRDGFAPSSYERITDTQQQEFSELGYEVDWQTADKERPEQQPTRQPRHPSSTNKPVSTGVPAQALQVASNAVRAESATRPASVAPTVAAAATSTAAAAPQSAQPQAVAWLSNLFAPTPQAQTSDSISSQAAAEAIEAIVNSGAQSLGAFGQVNPIALVQQAATAKPNLSAPATTETSQQDDDEDEQERRRRKSSRKPRPSKPRARRDGRDSSSRDSRDSSDSTANNDNNHSEDNSNHRHEAKSSDHAVNASTERAKRPSNSRRDSRGEMPRGETLSPDTATNKRDNDDNRPERDDNQRKSDSNRRRHDRSGDRQEQSAKSSNPNEVSLQVNEAPARHKQQEVVHLSLDDSKSQNSANSDNASSDARSSAQRSKSAESHALSPQESLEVSDAQKPQANDTNRQTADAKTNYEASSTSQSDALEKPSAAVDTVATGNNPLTNDASDVEEPERKSDNKSADQQIPPSDSEIKAEVKGEQQAPRQQATTQQVTRQQSPTSSPESSVDADNAESPAHAIEAKAATADKAQSEAVTSAVTTSDTVSGESVATPETAAKPAYDASALFADRYVAAQKYGLASNDPRQVMAKQSTVSSSKQKTEATSTASAARIQGSVGEFIHSVLPDASTQLSEQGVIACFIAAIDAFHSEVNRSQTIEGHDIPASTESGASENLDINKFDFSNFDFSNYGYEPLDESYLGRFSHMTQAISQIAIAQGKTEVSPRPISKRAANDPRGQHPDYQEVAAEDVNLKDSNKDAELASETAQREANALVNESQVESVTSESEALLIEDAEVIEHLKEATTMANSKASEHDSERADDVISNEHPADESQSDSTTESGVKVETGENAKDGGRSKGTTGSDDATSNADAVSNESSSDDPSTSSEQATSSDPSVSNDKVANEEPSTPSKTTIASYKNMIENVAEQLLPQQASLFNLTTPKVPKSRSRKAKSEPKKSASTDKAASSTKPANADSKDKSADNEE